jgi:hypothetical protein
VIILEMHEIESCVEYYKLYRPFKINDELRGGADEAIKSFQAKSDLTE